MNQSDIRSQIAEVYARLRRNEASRNEFVTAEYQKAKRPIKHPTSNDVVSVREAAHKMGLTYFGAWENIYCGKLQAKKLNGKWHILKTSLQDWLFIHRRDEIK